MQRPSAAETVYKLAIAGEQAGFTLEQMIQILSISVWAFCTYARNGRQAISSVWRIALFAVQNYASPSLLSGAALHRLRSPDSKTR